MSLRTRRPVRAPVLSPFPITAEQAAKLAPGTIGITSYAASALGDITYIELPETGADVSIEDAVGAVESVKSASDLLSPIDGTVTMINSAVEETPGLVNKDPEGAGWLFKLELKEGTSFESLLDAAAYKAFTEAEAEAH
jgi:glycine cleavage system H protein